MSQRLSDCPRRSRDLLLERLEDRVLFSGSPIPQATIDLPAENMINEDFRFAINFDNTGATASDVGYAPYVDVQVPDGFELQSAAYLGVPVTMVLAGVFDSGGNLVDPLSMLPVDHPLLGTPVSGGTPGESLYVIELPFGSFVPDQPLAEITIDAALNKADGAVVGTPLTVRAQGGFALGCDPLDNPGTDPPIFGPLDAGNITPTVIDLSKDSNAPEAETATGRNYPVTFSLAVDIADGETITNLDIRDLLPDSLEFIPGSIVVTLAPGVAASGQSITAQPGNPGPQNPPDNDLLVEFTSVTGTTSSQDILVTYQVFVPELDAGGAAVLDANDGDDVDAINDAMVSADYETGAVSDNDSATDFTLHQRSIAIQKNVSLANDVGGVGATPGDTLQYTLQFQISDFFTFGDLVISDNFSDGQLFDWGYGATFTITDRTGTQLGSFTVRAVTDPDGGETLVVDETRIDHTDDAAENPLSDGTTILTFNLSQALIDNGAADGILQGGAGLSGDDPYSPSAAAVGTITFRTVIQDEFADTFPSGDRSVDHGDSLTNGVTISGTIRENEDEDVDGTPFEVLGTEADGSSAGITIVPGSLIKSIYAVNGNTTLPSPLQIAPGDTVTYSLEYTLPSSDFENLTLADYLPLPIFSVLDPNADELAGPSWSFVAEASAALRAIAPLSGLVELGPNDTFFDSRPGFSDYFSTGNISVDGTANSLQFDFGTYDDPASLAQAIHLLFTLTVSDDPFADGLFLTNIAQSSEATTFLGNTTVDSIVQIELTQPALSITKGLVATDSSGSFSGPVGPAGVVFQQPGNPTAFTGTVTSDGLGSQPVDADLSGLDAGDQVRFAIVVENTGSSRTGAFDIQLRDALPAGFSFLGGSLQVLDGTGALINWTDVNAGNPGLFGDGIQLLDPGPTAAQPDGTDGGAIDGYDPTSGRNIAIIVYDAVLQTPVQPGEQLTNTATLTNYAGQEGGDDHTTTDVSDSSIVEISQPTLTKSLIGTGIINANNALNQAVIGEYVTYQVVVTVTEGTTVAAEVFDRLDAGLQFVSLNSVIASSGDLASTIDVFANTASFNPTITNGGRDLTFTLGTLTNVNTANATAETLTLNYTVRVDNVPANQTETSTQLNNLARFEWDLGGTPQMTANTSAANVEVIEPQLQLTKNLNPASGDASDTLNYTITIAHSPSSDTDAFDVTFADVLPGLLTVDFATGITATHSASGDIKAIFQLSGNTLETIPGLSFDLLSGETVTLTVAGTLQTAVQPGEVLANTAQTWWTSLDNGDPSDGDDASERDGTGGTNDYTASDSVNFTAAQPTIAKTLLSTGIINANNALNQAVIGEYVTYQVVVTVTEGTTVAAEVFDRLDAGLQFVSLNSLIASSGDLTSTIDVFANTASFNPTITNGGRDLTFNLGTLTNVNTANATAETLTLNYTVRVDNVPANQTETSTQLNNLARFEWDLGGTPQMTANTSAANVEVIEPQLQVTKNLNPASGDASDTLNYTITIAHSPSSDTDAFDVTFADVLPGLLTVDFATGITATHSASGDIKAIFQLSGNTLETIPGLSFDLLTGETVTLTVTGTLQTAVQPGEVLANTAQTWWTSLDNGDPSDGDDARERDGTGGTNDYTASDSVNFTAAQPTIAKALLSTGIINANNALNQAVIGEYVTYQVMVTVTEGTTVAAEVFDRLDAGLQFVSLNSLIASSGDLTSTIDVFANTASFNPTITNGGRDLTFNLGTLTNVNTANATAETLTLNYTVRVDNVPANQTETSTQLNNLARFEWDLGGTPQMTANTSAANVEVIEPQLQLTKNLNPASGDASDTLNYTITIAHSPSSDTDAFDVTFADVLPGLLTVDFATGITATHSASGDIKAIFQLSGNTLETIPGLSFDLLSGETVTLTVTGTLQTAVQPGEVLANTAQTWWTSLDNGDPSDGDDARERDGTGGTNDYTASDSVNFTAAQPTIAKTLLSTGIINANNALNQAVIGEYVTYQVMVTVTEGTTVAAEVFDRLDAGLQFVSLNSVIASSGDLTSTIDVFANTASFNPTITNGGRDLTFNLGTLTNVNTANATAETLTLNYTVRVDNVPANQTETSTQLNNLARFEWDLGGTPQMTANTSAANVEVIEPQLQITKSLNPISADAGDLITYTIDIMHGAGSDTDAFDVTFSDPLPAGISISFPGDFTITHSALGDISALFELAGSTLQTLSGQSFDLRLGETVTITINGTLTAAVQPGTTLSNTANVYWTSLDAGDLNDGDDVNERDGSGGTDDYADSASADLTIFTPALTKTLLGTSIVSAQNSNLQAVIGETAQYEVTFTVPEGTMNSVQIVDMLDVGLEFVSLDSITPRSGGILTGAVQTDLGVGDFSDTSSFLPAISGQTLTFGLGNLINFDTDNLSVETVTVVYTVRVTNVVGNQTESNTLLDNVAYVGWDAGGVPTQTSSADAADVEVIEPVLSIAKSVDDNSPHLGDRLTFTLIINHHATTDTDAFDLNLTDLLPAEMTLDLLSVNVVGAVVVADSSTGNLLELDLDQLLVGNTITVTYEADITANPAALNMPLTNVADISWTSLAGSVPGERTGVGGVNDYQVSDNIVTTPVGADLALTKDDGQATASAGQTFSYLITVTNNGTDAATGVTVTDFIPLDRLALVATDDPGNVTFNALSGELIWTPAGALDFAAPNNTISLLVTVQARDPLPAGIDSVTNTATVTQDDIEPTPADNTNSDVDTLLAAPDYTVTKDDGLAVTSPGDSITYTIIVNNVGNQDGTGVTVSDLFPTGVLTSVSADNGGVVDAVAGTITWNLGNLAAGDTVVLTVTADIRTAVAAGIDDFTNSVSVSDDGSNGADPTPGNNNASDTDTLNAAPDYTITKDDGLASATPGDAVTYTITVNNVGNQDGTGVTVSDLFPTNVLTNVVADNGGVVDAVAGTITWNLGNLAAGDTVVLAVTADVRTTVAAAIDDFTNTVIVADDGNNGTDPTPGNNTDSDIDTLNAAPDYAISKDDGLTTVQAGDALTYTVVVQNVGNQDGTGVTVSDTFPPHVLTNVVADNGGVVDAVAGTIVWNLGNLAAGDSLTLTVTADVVDPVPAGVNDLLNTVSVTDDGNNGTDPTPGNNTDSDTDTLDATPDYVLTKDDGMTSVVPGDLLTYTITVSNVGTQDGTGVVVSDAFDATALNILSADNGGIVDPVAGTINWSLGALAAGDSITLTVSAQVIDPAVAGVNDFTNSATVSDDGTNGADPTPGNNNDSDTDTLNAAPDYTVTKDDGLAVTSPGDSITYTIIVNNVGNQDGTGVTVSDLFPTGVLTNVSADNGGVVDAVAGTVNWNLGNLAAGDTVVLTVTADIRTAVAAGIDDFTNSVSVSDDGSNGADPTPGNNNASDTDTLNAAPDYTITKDDGLASATPGDAVTYTITVNNVGNQDGTGVTVSDLFPTNVLTNVVADNGGVVDAVAGTITWNLGNLAVGDTVVLAVTADVRTTVAAAIDDFTNTVIVADDGNNGTDPTPGNNTDSDIDTLNAAPDYAISKDDGLTTVQAGDALTYTVVVQNVGNQDGTGVTVSDTFPPHVLTNVVADNGGVVDAVAGTIVWNLGNLAAGDSVTLTVTADVVDPVPAGVDDLLNTVSVTDDGNNGTDPTPGNNTDSDTDTFNATPDYVLTKDDGVTSVVPGDLLTYTITVSNVGTQDGTGVVVSDAFDATALNILSADNGGIVDPVAGTINWSLGALAAGDSITLTVSAQVIDPAVAGVNDFTNSATVSDDGTNGADPTPGNNNDSDTDTLNAAPDYTVTKDDGLAVTSPGDSITYTIIVNNVGNQDGTGVTVSDLFPTGVLTNVSADNGGVVDAVAGTVNWNLGNLAAGDTVVLTVTADIRTAVAAGIDDFTNSVSVTDDGTNGVDPTPGNNNASDTDTLNAAPDYTITKDDGLASATPGDAVTYTITVNNVGNQDGTGVTVSDLFPTNVLTNVVADNGGVVDAVAGTITWNLGNLAAGDTVVLTVTADVRTTVAAAIDDFTNTVIVADDGNNGTDPTPGNNTDSDIDTLNAAPDYAISKDDGLTTVQAGDALTYTVVVQNVGNQDGTGVTVSDTFPPHVLTNVVADNGGVVDAVAGTIVWNLGNLAAGDSVTLTVTADVVDPVPAGVNDLLNTVSVTDDGNNGTDPTPGNNTDSDTDTLDATPDYVLTKDDGMTSVVPGDLLTYTITVSNVGTQDGTGVVVDDAFDATALNILSADNGGIVDPVAGTINWSLGALAAGDSITLTVSAQVIDPAVAGVNDFTNSATVSDDGTNGADPTPGNNNDSDTDTLNAAPDYTVTKDDGLAVTSPGDSITYTIIVNNVGNQDGTGVTVSDLFPTGVLTNVSADNGGVVDAVAGTVNWNLGNLAAGDTVVLTVTADIRTAVAAGIDDFTNSVSVSDDGSNGADPTPGNNNASDTDTLNAAPDYTITKDDGLASATPGDAVTYTITVNNVGNQDGTGVTVSDLFPTNVLTNVVADNGGVVDAVAGTITWNLGNLAAGDTVVLTVTADVRTTVAAAIDDFTNTVIVADDGNNGTDPTPGNNTDSDIDTLNAAPDYAISKDDGLTTVQAGDALTYTVVVQNVGNQDGTGVTVSDTFPPHVLTNVVADNGGVVDAVAGTIVWNLGNLAAGDSLTLTVTADVVDPVPAGVNDLLNTVSVTDDGNNGTDPTPGNNTDSDTNAVAATPDYVIFKDDGLLTASPGDPVTYTITIQNVGTQDGTGVVVSDAFPANLLGSVSADHGGVVDSAAGTITWNLGNLAAGDSVVLSVSGEIASTIPAGIEDLVNLVNVTDDGTNGMDSTPENNSHTDMTALPATPDYRITKDDGLDDVAADTTVTYSINVENVGNQDGTGIVITDSYPMDRFEVLSVDNGGVVDAAAGTITWNLPQLAAGDSVTLTVEGRVPSALAAGIETLINSAEVHDDGANGSDPTPLDNVTADEDIVLAAPDLWIAKQDGDTSAVVGGLVVYTIEYGNRGTQDATGVMITEVLPSGTEFDAANSAPGWVDLGNGQVTVAVGTLAVGENRVLQFAVRVTMAAAANVQLENVTSIADDASNGPDLVPGDNTSSESTPLDSGTISGFVFVDVNNNASFDAAEDPVVDVEIRLEGVTGAGDPVSLMTSTNGSGYYEFSALPPGTYVVRQEQPAFLLDGAESSIPGSGMVTANDEFTVQLQPGQSASLNNFGERGLIPQLISKRAFLASSRELDLMLPPLSSVTTSVQEPIAGRALAPVNEWETAEPMGDHLAASAHAARDSDALLQSRPWSWRRWIRLTRESDA